MLDNFWILLIFPLAGSLFNGIVGKKLSTHLVSLIGCGSVLFSFLVSMACFVELLAIPSHDRVVRNSLFTWIEAGSFSSSFSFLIDPLSIVMILIVTGVGFLIHVYSVTYMKGESGYYRYFSYLNLFIFMMSILVLADNYLLMFVGWEGVGLCSYLLIGYYFDTRVAGDAAKKAFIVNRIGDVGFILGVFLIFQSFGSVEYLSVFESVATRFPSAEEGFGLLSVITLLLFVGATGKSAQIPLYVWLPDAMAGPTPVSALIHAATMVTAGVYMIARSSALYSRAPETMWIVAVVGVLTALLAALIAVAQRDIKKVLAYSTISQLGYMFLAVGVGAFGAGIFHLATHAFFKALLFLGSGSVILALHHEQDMFKMGGLRKYLPVTWMTMWIATLAIAGIPPFSGFFSKDEILWKAFSSQHGHIALWGIGVIVAALTAFYMSRLMFVTFSGEERFHSRGHEQDEAHHGRQTLPKEPNVLVTGTLFILAVLAAVAGVIGLPAYLGPNLLEGFLEPAFHHVYLGAGEHGTAHADHTLEIALTIPIVLLALFSIWLAHRVFVSRPQTAERMAQSFPGLHSILENKFFVDEIYNVLLVWPVQLISRFVLWRGIDVRIIDGLVNGTADWMLGWSERIRKIQGGYARVYASWILFGALVILLYYYVTL